jgi:hypothetical protein
MQITKLQFGDDGANGRALNMFSLRLCWVLNQFGLGRMSSSDVCSSIPTHADKQESREQQRVVLWDGASLDPTRYCVVCVYMCDGLNFLIWRVTVKGAWESTQS